MHRQYLAYDGYIVGGTRPTTVTWGYWYSVYDESWKVLKLWNGQSWMVPGTWATTMVNCWQYYGHEGYMGGTTATNAGIHSWYCSPKKVPRWYIGYDWLRCANIIDVRSLQLATKAL